jgi:hypothetical protein
MTGSELAWSLREIGDGLAAQFSELARDPDPAACEALAANLEGARQHLVRLRASLMREGGRDG